MTEVVLRHDDLPNQPIVVPVAADGSVSVEWQASGWWLDLDTDPVKARLEKPLPKPEPSAPVPHFAEPAAQEPEAAPVAEPPADPDPPETTEQGDTSLDHTEQEQ